MLLTLVVQVTYALPITIAIAIHQPSLLSRCECSDHPQGNYWRPVK